MEKSSDDMLGIDVSLQSGVVAIRGNHWIFGRIAPKTWFGRNEVAASGPALREIGERWNRLAGGTKTAGRNEREFSEFYGVFGWETRKSHLGDACNDANEASGLRQRPECGQNNEFRRNCLCNAFATSGHLWFFVGFSCKAGFAGRVGEAFWDGKK